MPLLKLTRALLMRKGIEASVKSRVLLVRLEDEGFLSVIFSSEAFGPEPMRVVALQNPV